MPGRIKGIVFESAEITGTGSAQVVVHGLNNTPQFTQVVLTEFGAAENPNVTYGTIDQNTATITVASATVKFKLIAVA